MSVLALYFGTSRVSSLFFGPKNPNEPIADSFPYTYVKELYSNQVKEAEFYGLLINILLKKHKAKPPEVDILTSSFLKPPQVIPAAKLSAGLVPLLNGVASFQPVVANSFGIATKEGTFASAKTDDDPFISNLSIYPQLVPTDISSQIHVDKGIIGSELLSNMKFDSDLPVVFLGDRFSQKTCEEALDYILMSEILNHPGVYNIYEDRSNSLILEQLLKMHLTNYEPKNFGLNSTGVLISTHGPTECLLTTDMGTQQFFEIGEDKVFVVPLGAGSRADIHVKNRELGKVERSIKGGKVGIIFDTREGKGDPTSDLKTYNEGIKQLCTHQ